MTFLQSVGVAVLILIFGCFLLMALEPLVRDKKDEE